MFVKSADRGKFTLDKDPISVYNGIVDDADGGNDMDRPIYGYYMTTRPPESGIQPNNELAIVCYRKLTWHEAISEEVWAWVCYEQPLTQEDLDAYSMIPDEDNPVRYRQYGVVRKETKTDADGKRMVIYRQVPGENGQPFSTSYKRKALIMLFDLQKKERRVNGESDYKLAVIVTKKRD